MTVKKKSEKVVGKEIFGELSDLHPGGKYLSEGFSASHY